MKPRPRQVNGWRGKMRGMPFHTRTVATLVACTFAFLGNTSHAQPDTAHERVALPGFRIDRTEVTIAQFARFVQATGTVTEAERSGGGFEYVGGWQRRPGWNWRTPDGTSPASKQLPAVHLTHAEAAAYTEQRASPPAPWQRGKTYPYPTGDSPAGANTSERDPWPRAAPAGATAAGVNGLLDMGANVWEWVSDARGAERRTMGGSWWYGASQMRAEVDAWKAADFTAVYIGFRCAQDLS